MPSSADAVTAETLSGMVHPADRKAFLQKLPPRNEIDVATLVHDGLRQTAPPVTLPSPPLIALKDQIWHSVTSAVGQ